MNIHKSHKETQKSDNQKHNFYFTVTSFYIIATSLPVIAIVVLHKAGGENFQEHSPMALSLLLLKSVSSLIDFKRSEQSSMNSV